MKMLALLAALAIAGAVAAQPRDVINRDLVSRDLLNRALINQDYRPPAQTSNAVFVPPPSILDSYQGAIPPGGLVILGNKDSWYILNPNGLTVAASNQPVWRFVADDNGSLKSPEEVAEAWRNTMDQARESTPLPKSLLDLNAPATVPPPTFSPDARTYRSPAPRVPQRRFPYGPNDLINRDYQPPPFPPDLPGNRSIRNPEVLSVPPSALPPGARRWEYRGQTFWLIPLNTNPTNGGVVYRLLPSGEPAPAAGK